MPRSGIPPGSPDRRSSWPAPAGPGAVPAVSIALRPAIRNAGELMAGRRRFVAPLAIGIVWVLAVLFGWAPAPSAAQSRPIPAEARLGTLRIGVLPDAEFRQLRARRAGS